MGFFWNVYMFFLVGVRFAILYVGERRDATFLWEYLSVFFDAVDFVDYLLLKYDLICVVFSRLPFYEGSFMCDRIVRPKKIQYGSSKQKWIQKVWAVSMEQVADLYWVKHIHIKIKNYLIINSFYKVMIFFLTHQLMKILIKKNINFLLCCYSFLCFYFHFPWNRTVVCRFCVFFQLTADWQAFSYWF